MRMCFAPPLVACSVVCVWVSPPAFRLFTLCCSTSAVRRCGVPQPSAPACSRPPSHLGRADMQAQGGCKGSGLEGLRAC